VPSRFANLSSRLVTANGVMLMAVAAAAALVYTQAQTKYLVIMYSINVFVTFSLSQMGMVRHWWLVRRKEARWRKRLFINGVGLVLTTFILCSVVILKFNEGGWLTIFFTGSLVIGSVIIKRHYKRTGRLLKRLDGLVEMAELDIERQEHKPPAGTGEYDPKAKTAVLFVNGFSGTGLHTLFTIIRLFSGIYKNFVFVQIGLVDSGVFKGAEEIEQLKAHIEKDANRYAEYMRRHGFFAECHTSIAVDIVEESIKVAPRIMERFPQAIFFAGQLVFPEDSFFTRWLHNYSAFAIQRRFYHLGMPIVILPIRV
jgi:hypothetical protein